MIKVALACEPGGGIEMCRKANALGIEVGKVSSIKKHINGSIQVWDSKYDGTREDLEKHGTFTRIWAASGSKNNNKKESSQHSNSSRLCQLEVFTLAP